MKNYLIVDGYNIINQWSKLEQLAQINLEDAREKLITIMENHSKYNEYNIIIVFDAYKNDDMEHKEIFGNITIVYTQKNQTADSYIEKLVYEIPSIYEVTVATSDYTVQKMIIARGCNRISARELEKEVEFANRFSLDKTNKQCDSTKNNLSKTIDNETYNKLEKLRKESID